jgi:hypothetical protein
VPPPLPLPVVTLPPVVPPPIPEPIFEPELPPAPEYHPVAPVELTFDDEGGPLGVRPGTRTFEEFQRAASALFTELRRARPR